MKTLITAVASLLVLASAAGANAQDQRTLDIRTIVQKEEVVVADDGSTEKRLVEADLVVPGDQVIYTLTITNVGEQPADNVVITNPLPAELTYIGGSATGADAEIQFSVDGGENFGAVSELSVVESGTERPARDEDVTHIRWVIVTEIAPGQEGIAQFRARLN